MRLSDFDYELPSELIAQRPASKRDHSRLMVVNRKTGEISHDNFYNILNYLDPQDLVVFNETKVFPARLFGTKETGGKVEILLLHPVRNTAWSFMGKNVGRAKRVNFSEDLVGEITEPGVIEFNIENDELMVCLDRIGNIPLPPYIDPFRTGLDTKEVRRRYQTVYAENVGSVAAPTAGFHFTKKLIKRLSDEGIKQVKITLHVGLGTFLPVKTDNILEHRMHSERYRISQDSKFKIQDSKSVVAVGTTTVRTLESWARTGETEGETDIFIYPGFEFKIVKKMITNFHLPKSTLMMLVSAFAGHKLIMKAYKEAVKEKYRFFSFGDAMLIL